ncbi:MAG: carboxymuconolactone decarboxylase family protein [candidate division Zixibacteria bacterium]|nr:carboxymuconolactone decarboxylase family protein [candidate division Zixibacteria bacterium]
MKSYELLEERMKTIYFEFYQETYREGTALDNKTKELIAIAASLSSGCQNCLEGHLKKAMKYGASGAEVRESVAIAVGVAAATIVDRTDLANFHMNIARLLDKADQTPDPETVSTPPKPRVSKGRTRATMEETP